MDDRRRFLSRAGLAGAAGVLGGVLTGAGPAQASPARARRVHGTWAMQITFPDTPGSSEQGIVAFTADGIVVESNTGSRYAGIGSWRPGSGGFSYGWREQIFSAAGALLFVVHVQQDATFTGPGAFTSTGTGTAYDPSGNLVASQASQISGTRY